MRSLTALLLFFGMFCSACSNSSLGPVATDPVRIGPVTSHQQLSQNHNGGVIGKYTFTDNDGGVETGQLMADEDGHVSLVPDRGATVYVNWLFQISVDFLNPHGYVEIGGENLPVYYRGDVMMYSVAVDYNRQLPLNLFPLLYTELSAQHVIVETGEELFEGAWTEDLSLAPMGNWSTIVDWSISDLPGSGEIVQLQLELDMMFLEGNLQLNLYSNGWRWYFGG